MKNRPLSLNRKHHSQCTKGLQRSTTKCQGLCKHGPMPPNEYPPVELQSMQLPSPALKPNPASHEEHSPVTGSQASQPGPGKITKKKTAQKENKQDMHGMLSCEKDPGGHVWQTKAISNSYPSSHESQSPFVGSHEKQPTAVNQCAANTASARPRVHGIPKR